MESHRYRACGARAHGNRLHPGYLAAIQIASRPFDPRWSARRSLAANTLRRDYRGVTSFYSPTNRLSPASVIASCIVRCRRRDMPAESKGQYDHGDRRRLDDFWPSAGQKSLLESRNLVSSMLGIIREYASRAVGCERRANVTARPILRPRRRKSRESVHHDRAALLAGALLTNTTGGAVWAPEHDSGHCVTAECGEHP